MNLESSLLNKSKRFARKTLIAGLTSSLIFLASCGGGGGSGGGSSGNGGENGGDGGGNGDSPEDESPQTYVLPAEEMDNISSVEDGRIVFFQPVDYLPGDLIVAPVGNNAPDGFLREITSTSDNKTFYTSQAKVEQVVPDGSFEFQETLSPSEAYLHSDKKGVSLSQSLSGGFDVNFDNVILFDADGNPYTTYDQVIANGTLHLDSNFYFQFSAASGHMTDLTFQNTSNESSSLEVIALASLNNLDEEINIGNIDFSPFVVWTPTFPSIPVVFRPNLELYVGLNGSISLIQASVNQEATSTFGVSYSDGSWSPINTFSNDFTFVPPNQPEISDMKAYVGGRLNLLLYGVLGPSGELNGYLNFNANADSWEFRGGLEALVGIDMGIFSSLIGNYSAKVIDYSTVLAQGNREQTPQNGKIIFVSNRSSSLNIYSINPDGSGETGLATTSEWENYPSISPDGTKILFCSKVPLSSDNDDIYLMNSDGSGKTQKTSSSTDDCHPAFSRNGAQFAYSRGTNQQIYIKNLSDSASTIGTLITTYSGASSYYHRDLDWSPTADVIAFSSNKETSYREIYKINAVEGSIPIRLTTTSAYNSHSDWSPDGTQIAFDSNRTGDYEIWIMNADGTNPINISNSSSTHDENPYWSPDQKRIVYVSRPVGYSSSSDELWIMNADGSNKTRITNNSYNDGHPVWASQ